MGWRSSFRVFGFLAIAACTEPQSSEPSYTVIFQNTDTWSYGGPGCVGNPNTLYCGTWNPDSYTFSGTLRGNPATVFVLNGAEFYRPEGANLIFYGQANATGCHYFSFTGQQGNDFSGTYHEATDCHSAGRKGTYHAYRSDLPE